MKKIKVLHLLEWMELGGGLEQMAGEIVSGLDKSRFEAEIWCIHRGGALADHFRSQGVTVKILNIPTYHNPLNIIKLACMFIQSKPDIIHTHVYFASTIGRLAGMLAGVRVFVNHVHSSYRHYSPVNLLVESLLGKVSKKIICVSMSVRDFVTTHERIDPRKVVMIHNGITRQTISSSKELMRRSLGIDERDMVIASVGSLYENKGHKILLEALALLKDDHPSIVCLIVGEGPMERRIKAYASELGLGDRVRFLGLRRDVPDILNASDLFVLASIYREGLPVSILEAMAYGVPVISSRIGGTAEIVRDGLNGCLVPPKDPETLAESIKGLIIDEDKRRRLSKEGLRTFERSFTSVEMVAKIARLYEDCVHGG